MPKSWFKIILTVLLVIGASTCSAQNFKFVDAEDTTGYYVDMDTIDTEGAEIIDATIAVVKAQQNKMYTYKMRINHKERTYQILSSQIVEYNTKLVLESNDQARPFRPYSAKSQMSELIEFILNGDER